MDAFLVFLLKLFIILIVIVLLADLKMNHNITLMTFIKLITLDD